MKSFQSKFSNEKSNAGTSSKPSSKSETSSSSGCCCGSKLSGDVEEVDIIDMEEK